jgi:hypothetical protein
MDAELRQQPTPDEGTDNSNEEIAEDPEPSALHDLASQPFSEKANHQDDKKT